MSLRAFITTAMRAMRSAACWRILALLLFRRHLIVPQIWGKYGLARIFRLFTTVPKPLSITLASSLTCLARQAPVDSPFLAFHSTADACNPA